MSAQPSLSKVFGVKITIGVVCQADRMEITFPVSLEGGSSPLATLADNAVESIVASVLTALCGCLTADAYISFVQGYAMDLGLIPWRRDFTPTEHPGTLNAGAMPNNVTGLIVFYADPIDLDATQRMRVGKIFMPGLPHSEVVGDYISTAVHAAYDAFANLLLNGFPAAVGTGKWWRSISDEVSTVFAGTLIRSDAAISRSHVATQKRRMIPH